MTKKVFASTEDIIQASLTEENRSVIKREWEAQNHQFVAMMGVLQQQIISLDVTIGLLIELNGRNFESVDHKDGSSTLRVTPWTNDQLVAFKDEIKARVEKIAENMTRQREKSSIIQ